MKKTILKVTLAATMMFGSILIQGAVINTASAAASQSQPVMTDNLIKYGLKKDVELPVTVTAGGLSYTLEKIMIYDSKSKDAQGLAKQYGYDLGGAQYFVWTKITVENKSKSIIQQNAKDLRNKWRMTFGDLSKGEPSAAMPEASYYKSNNKEALWDWKLNPGEKLSTYQGFRYTGEFNCLNVRVDNSGQSISKFIVELK
ncbi:hypothetical protein AMQ84_22675 [Paenibacillus riograndensis]|uniref:Uncharacterized protein n=1 Tax=Paenibacillus riograndensis TaxID=483937 RepID=A0A132TPL6_9BACL|nr:hypothetical protein [Paenibacillus riograndensis]KWX73318.1 hypothetical protein AMQ84_22675 [Paenibacillus riograndensis]KWX85567.1 hypothetical protein AMQ83_24000 [Paenibacillus riograndensis]